MSADQQHFPGFQSASPFGTQILSGRGKSSGGILPTILGGLGSAFLGPAGPIVGSLASAALNFGLNRIESGIQNRYNSPKNVIKRLGQAGLPTAAYLQGGGNESAHSSQQYASPDLGTAEAISREQVNRFQKQQFELMKREMALKEAETKYKGILGGKVLTDTEGKTIENRFLPEKLNTGIQLQKAQEFLTRNKGVLQGMQNDVYKALKDQGVQVAMEQGRLKLIGQQFDVNKVRMALDRESIQQKISEIAKNAVAMEAMRTQMSVAQQTIRLREWEGMIKDGMVEDLKTGSGFMGWMGAMILRLAGK